MMSPYNTTETLVNSSQTGEQFQDQELLESMWKLFEEIGKFLEIRVRTKRMKPGLETFIATRIRLFPSYLEEYKNAAEVIEELVSQWGKARGYRKLFTDPDAAIRPPVTPIAKARQRVVNEFIFLQLVLSGKMFGKEETKKRKGKNNISPKIG